MSVSLYLNDVLKEHVACWKYAAKRVVEMQSDQHTTWLPALHPFHAFDRVACTDDHRIQSACMS